MKKATFQPFKFGQNKTSKRTYFPATLAKPSAAAPSEARPERVRAFTRASREKPGS